VRLLVRFIKGNPSLHIFFPWPTTLPLKHLGQQS
jgi:hypothetical protein